MTDTILAREATVVAASNDTEDSRLVMVRESVVTAHHFPEDETELRLGRLGVVVAISRPHGWS